MEIILQRIRMVSYFSVNYMFMTKSRLFNSNDVVLIQHNKIDVYITTNSLQFDFTLIEHRSYLKLQLANCFEQVCRNNGSKTTLFEACWRHMRKNLNWSSPGTRLTDPYRFPSAALSPGDRVFAKSPCAAGMLRSATRPRSCRPRRWRQRKSVNNRMFLCCWRPFWSGQTQRFVVGAECEVPAEPMHVELTGVCQWISPRRRVVSLLETTPLLACSLLEKMRCDRVCRVDFLQEELITACLMIKAVTNALVAFLDQWLFELADTNDAA